MAAKKDKAKPKEKKVKPVTEKKPVGRPKSIESPEYLLQLFRDYVKHAKNNPYLVHDYVGKDAHEVRKEKERPLSWVGFECYLYDQDIISDLSDYEENKNESYTEYLPIIRLCKKIIQKDQLEGASAGIYQQNIVARLLGLTDKKDITTDGEKLNTPKQVYKLPDGTEISFE